MDEEALRKPVRKVLHDQARLTGAASGAGASGGDVLDDISKGIGVASQLAGTAMHLLPLFGLGMEEPKRKHPKKAQGGSLLDMIPVVGQIASLFGAGASGGEMEALRQTLAGSALSGGERAEKPKPKRKPSKHAQAVKRVMRANPGMKLPEASRYVKEHRLA
jgi:hypothetical protein